MVNDEWRVYFVSSFPGDVTLRDGWRVFVLHPWGQGSTTRLRCSPSSSSSAASSRLSGLGSLGLARTERGFGGSVRIRVRGPLGVVALRASGYTGAWASGCALWGGGFSVCGCGYCGVVVVCSGFQVFMVSCCLWVVGCFLVPCRGWGSGSGSGCCCYVVLGSGVLWDWGGCWSSCWL